jgi:hypothetical protein
LGEFALIQSAETAFYFNWLNGYPPVFNLLPSNSLDQVTPHDRGLA